MKSLLLCALLPGCALLTSPNAQYTYQRTGADCTLIVDSGRSFPAGIDVKLVACDVTVTAGKVDPSAGNSLKDVTELVRSIKDVPK